MTAKPKDGALRYRVENSNEWVVVQPCDPLFFTAAFLATEWFDGVAWKPIYTEAELALRRDPNIPRN